MKCFSFYACWATEDKTRLLYVKIFLEGIKKHPKVPSSDLRIISMYGKNQKRQIQKRSF